MKSYAKSPSTVDHGYTSIIKRRAKDAMLAQQGRDIVAKAISTEVQNGTYRRMRKVRVRKENSGALSAKMPLL